MARSMRLSARSKSISRPGLIQALTLVFAMVPIISAAQETQLFQFTVAGGERTKGPEVMRVKHGDQVEMVWRSNEPVEVHLHGYDVLVNVAAGGEKVMKVEATATGRFPVSIHRQGGKSHSHRPLTYLEVHPR